MCSFLQVRTNITFRGEISDRFRRGHLNKSSRDLSRIDPQDYKWLDGNPSSPPKKISKDIWCSPYKIPKIQRKKPANTRINACIFEVSKKMQEVKHERFQFAKKASFPLHPKTMKNEGFTPPKYGL